MATLKKSNIHLPVYELPDNYKGSNLLEIKKMAERIELEEKNTKPNRQIPNNQNELRTKEDKSLKGPSNNRENKINQSYLKENKTKRLDYEKLILSTKPSKLKPESLLIDHEKLRINENRSSNSDLPISISQSLNTNKATIEIATTKFLFGMMVNKKSEQAIRDKAIQLFKWAIRMIRAWLRILDHIIKKNHRQQQEYLFSNEYLDENTETTNDNDDLRFNKYDFKATKEIEVTSEIKKILTRNPKGRTEEQILMVMNGLAALPSFNDYPEHLKKKLCTVAYFRQISARRVIIRQGHVAEFFYFIISGTAIVTITTNSGQTLNVNILNRGASFGELALLHRSTRNASVISKTPMQLLVIERDDFYDIFMHHSSDCSKYPEHISFVKEIPIFNHINLDNLVSYTRACLCNYYKNLAIVSLNDIESEWVYIVKSGSCTVLKELQIPIESKLVREPTLTLNDIESAMQAFGQYNFIPIALDDGIGKHKSKTRYLWRDLTMIKPKEYFYLKSENFNNFIKEKKIEPKDYISVFIKVTDLYPKGIFGLSSVIFSSEDKIRTENMASVMLISNKAEIILISKKFLAQKSNENLVQDIRKGIMQYPSEQVFIDNYMTSMHWEKYKYHNYQSTLKRLN